MTKKETENTKPKLYDTDFLKYDERINEKVLINFKSSLVEDTNYEGEGKILSNNKMCCTLSTEGRFFSLYYDECIDKQTRTFDKETGDTLEIYKISKDRKPKKHNYVQDDNVVVSKHLSDHF